MHAQARPSVVVRSTSVALEPLLGRLCAELATAGYAVTLDLSAPPPVCRRGQGAWVTLASSPIERAAVIATVCFDGTEISVGGPRAEPARLAISTAEALNGLSATPPPPDAPEPAAAATRPPPPRERRRAPDAVSVSQTLIIDPAKFPLFWGTAFDIELSFSPHASLVLGGFFPIARARVSTSAAELRVGVSFLRVGPALRYSFERFAFAGSLVVGPAYTWVTANAVSPYVAQTDFALGVFGGAGLAVAYPEQSRVFAVAGARASVLLPSPRLELPNEQPRALGPLLFEASLGFGVRL